MTGIPGFSRLAVSSTSMELYMNTCITCKFSFMNGDLSLTCRRYPPTVLFEEVTATNHYGDRYQQQAVTSRFVEVNNEDWCGEYVAI